MRQRWLPLWRCALAEPDCKILQALVHAPLSSGFNEPLELVWIALFRFAFSLCGDFCHKATSLLDTLEN